MIQAQDIPVERQAAAGPTDYQLLGELATGHLAQVTRRLPSSRERLVLNIDPRRLLKALAEELDDAPDEPADSRVPGAMAAVVCRHAPQPSEFTKATSTPPDQITNREITRTLHGRVPCFRAVVASGSMSSPLGPTEKQPGHASANDRTAEAWHPASSVIAQAAIVLASMAVSGLLIRLCLG